MGASREVQFSALAEPALLLGLAALARRCGTASLAGLFTATDAGGLAEAGPLAALVAMALFIVYLVENARIPVDDPNTHLELTMIHEVMVLDHSGPDLAFILYGTTVKLWLLGSLVVHTVIPRSAERGAAGLALSLAGMAAIGVATGCVESSMARLRMLRVPQLLLGASALAVMALVLAFR
jgi:formate hydrogenlyase subunit 4